jgi:hypothetical protein
MDSTDMATKAMNTFAIEQGGKCIFETGVERREKGHLQIQSIYINARKNARTEK